MLVLCHHRRNAASQQAKKQSSLHPSSFSIGFPSTEVVGGAILAETSLESGNQTRSWRTLRALARGGSEGAGWQSTSHDICGSL